jgi:hypothetical protein
LHLSFFTLNKAHKIIEIRYLKVNYESTVDWRELTDYLRCSPMFYGHPRYDCVIVQTVVGPIFAKLLFIFTQEIGEAVYPIALIQPYDAPTGPRLHKDTDLNFYRA